jgi:hypothetical protein
VGNSGYIDWHRLDTSMPWIRQRQGEHTYVYAFWLVDYGRATKDHGVGLLKNESEHPDWFVHAATADHVLAAYTAPQTIVSPNFQSVFADNLSARPLLGSVLLGSTDCSYRNGDQFLWWAADQDLTRRGRRLIKDLNQLYLRPPVLVTFVDVPTDGTGGSRDPS